MPGISTRKKIKSGLSIPAVHILAVIALGLIIYSNTFHAPFTFDDREIYIVKNLAVRDLGYFLDPSALDGLSDFYAKGFFRTRLIGHLSFALNYKLHGLDAKGYHVANLLIHLINALLVYRLVRLTLETPFFKARRSSSAASDDGRPPLIAFLSSLFFVCHPVQTQAVTYVSQRITSLAALFFLLSLVLYGAWRLSSDSKRKSRSLYILAVLSAVLAMKTKEIAFTLPVAIAMYEFMFFGGKPKRRALFLFPFILTMLIIPYYFLWVYKHPESPAGGLRLLTDMPRTDYLLTQFTVIVTYIRLLFFPADQNLDYDYPVYKSFFNPNVFLSFLFLLSLLGLAMYLLWRSRPSARGSNGLSATGYERIAAFGLFWFFITLTVESSIIPIRDVIFEHRVYLPSVGFIIALVAGGAVINRRAGIFGAPVLVLALLLLSYAAYARNQVWTDEVRLWEDVVRKSPDKGRVHLNLGLALGRENRTEAAIRELQTALKLNPYDIEARNKLGTFYTRKNMAGEAVKEFQTIIGIKPDYSDAHVNLGAVYEKLNRLQEAAEEYLIALQLDPRNAESHNNLGALMMRQNRPAEAAAEFHAALKLNPFYADAHYNLGTVYAGRNMPDDAMQEYLAALNLDPGHAEAHNNVGALYAGRGRLAEALAEFRTALKLKPDYADAYNNLMAVQNMRESRQIIPE